MKIESAVVLDARKITSKVTNNEFGKFVSHEWKRLIDPYTPRNTGQLMTNVVERPFSLWYKSKYAHYMYTGVVYVDPKTGISGFLTDEGWKSRYGVQKIPSNRTFNYSRTLNPSATDHWDKVAANSGQLNKLYRTINNYFNNKK